MTITSQLYVPNQANCVFASLETRKYWGLSQWLTMGRSYKGSVCASIWSKSGLQTPDQKNRQNSNESNQHNYVNLNILYLLLPTFHGFYSAGLQPGPCGGELQPIWVTEPNCSKITMSLEHSTREPFPKEDPWPMTSRDHETTTGFRRFCDL